MHFLFWIGTLIVLDESKYRYLNVRHIYTFRSSKISSFFTLVFSLDVLQVLGSSVKMYFVGVTLFINAFKRIILLLDRNTKDMSFFFVILYVYDVS